jgi:hypothetical protein
MVLTSIQTGYSQSVIHGANVPQWNEVLLVNTAQSGNLS